MAAPDMRWDALDVAAWMNRAWSDAGGFKGASIIEGNTYRDMSTMIVVPTRGGARPDEPSKPGTIVDPVVQTWLSLARPTNHRSAWMFVRGHEVSTAYNHAMKEILANPQYASMPYILTVEDDNLLPPHALLALLQSIERGPYDAVGGVYHMKGNIAVPMAFGRPGAVDGSGEIDLSPVNLTEAIIAPTDDLDAKIVPVNGIACGCTLWRTQLFRDLEPPWFRTFTRFDAYGNVEVMTQDMDFSRKCVKAGKRFAIDTRVLAGHIDAESGVVY